jgi:hypothetical protein
MSVSKTYTNTPDFPVPECFSPSYWPTLLREVRNWISLNSELDGAILRTMNIGMKANANEKQSALEEYKEKESQKLLSHFIHYSIGDEALKQWIKDSGPFMTLEQCLMKIHSDYPHQRFDESAFMHELEFSTIHKKCQTYQGFCDRVLHLKTVAESMKTPQPDAYWKSLLFQLITPELQVSLPDDISVLTLCSKIKTLKKSEAIPTGIMYTQGPPVHTPVPVNDTGSDSEKEYDHKKVRKVLLMKKEDSIEIPVPSQSTLAPHMLEDCLAVAVEYMQNEKSVTARQILGDKFGGL